MDGVKEDSNRSAIAIGFALIVFSGFVDWLEYEVSMDGDDYYYSDYSFDATLKGPMDDDTRDSYENAGYLWYLSIIGLGAILLSRTKLEEHIGDENYGNFFLALGVLCLLLAYSVYSEIKDDMDDLDDASGEGVDVDITYKMGYYMALIGPLGVLYGGYIYITKIRTGHEF